MLFDVCIYLTSAIYLIRVLLTSRAQRRRLPIKIGLEKGGTSIPGSYMFRLYIMLSGGVNADDITLFEQSFNAWFCNRDVG